MARIVEDPEGWAGKETDGGQCDKGDQMTETMALGPAFSDGTR